MLILELLAAWDQRSPPQRFEHGVDELAAHLGFIVVAGEIGGAVVLKPLNQRDDGVRWSHGSIRPPRR